MGLSGCGVGYHGSVDGKGVFEDATGDNRGFCSRDTNIQTFYRRRADVGVQSIPRAVGPRPHSQSDGEGGRVKDRKVSSVKKLSRISSLAVCSKLYDLIHTS